MANSELEQLVDVLRDYLIADLLMSDVSQRSVAGILRVGINRVNRVGKLLKKSARAKGSQNP